MTAHTLHSNPSSTWNRHQDSMMASLAHRLEAARMAQNFQLVELLEQEKQQISTQPQSPRSTHWLQSFKQSVAEAIFGGTDLQVCRFANGSDLWWYAIDPQTGRYVYADSEAELRLWIQQNYQGR